MKSLHTLGLVGLIGIASCAPSQKYSVTTPNLPTPYRLEQAPLPYDSTATQEYRPIAASSGLSPMVFDDGGVRFRAVSVFNGRIVWRACDGQKCYSLTPVKK